MLFLHAPHAPHTLQCHRLRSHYVADITGETAWEADSSWSEQEEDVLFSVKIFWQQELQHNKQVGTTPPARQHSGAELSWSWWLHLLPAHVPQHCWRWTYA